MAIFWIIMFILSIYLLVKSSDEFIHYSEKLGKDLGISSFIIGATIVSIGTSLPELVTSIIAVLNKTSDIVIGNVVGSNIANILVVGGISAIIGKKLIMKHNILKVDIPIFILSAFLMSFMVLDKRFTLFEAILCIIGMVVYTLYAIRSNSREENVKNRRFHFKNLFGVVIAAILLYLGAKYTVISAIKLSEYFRIGTDILAISAIALGTSLPELSVGIRAAMKGKSDIIIGDIIGSNIFNSLAVLGIPALFGNLVIPQSIISFSIPIMAATTIIFSFMVIEKEITIWEGSFLVLFYIFFIAKLFGFI